MQGLDTLHYLSQVYFIIAIDLIMFLQGIE